MLSRLVWASTVCGVPKIMLCSHVHVHVQCKSYTAVKCAVPVPTRTCTMYTVARVLRLPRVLNTTRMEHYHKRQKRTETALSCLRIALPLLCV